jgi:hypothetical protein
MSTPHQFGPRGPWGPPNVPWTSSAAAKVWPMTSHGTGTRSTPWTSIRTGPYNLCGHSGMGL